MPQDFKDGFSRPASNAHSVRGNSRRRQKRSATPWREKLAALKFKQLTPNQQPPKAPKDPSPRRQLPSPGWFPVFGALAGFIFILVLVSSVGRDVDASVSVAQEEWLKPPLESTSATDQAQISSTLVARGDNAIAALGRIGIGASASHQLVHDADEIYRLRNIRIGHRFTRRDTPSGMDLLYNIDGSQRLHMHRASDSDSWQATLEPRTIETRQRIAHGQIVDSLFGAAEAAGMDQRTTMNLVDIFAWDIDFARDMRPGDTFTVLYDERYDDEGNMLESSIQAAEFVNQGQQYRAVRYEQADGKVAYFTPDGKSMRKAYLKAPVKFSRISSRFTLKRKHPVLGYTRAHRGVDYAAPSGTPIHAIGDGYISFKGWKNGYGNFILIRHNNRNHSTAYGHMLRFAKGIRNGVRVHQGQVIGYVGMTGLATGPHLHFEFRVRGMAVNPLTVKHPPAAPIAKAERERFMEQTAPLLSLLQQQPRQLGWG